MITDKDEWCRDWVRGHDILRCLAECLILQEKNSLIQVRYLSGTFYWRHVFDGDSWKQYGYTNPLPPFSQNTYRCYRYVNITDNYKENLLHDFDHLPIRVKNMLKLEYGIEILNNQINNYEKLTIIHLRTACENHKNFGRKSVFELKKFLNKYGFDYI